MPIYTSAVIATVLPNIGGWAGSFLVHKNSSWAFALKKPLWTPPKYALGITWTCLYSSMGFASYLVWKEGGGFQGKAAIPLALYSVQLALNWAWTPLFFVYRSFKWVWMSLKYYVDGVFSSTIDGLFLMASAGVCSQQFHRVDSKAGLLMLPYLAWLGLASSYAFTAFWANYGSIEVNREGTEA